MVTASFVCCIAQDWIPFNITPSGFRHKLAFTGSLKLQLFASNPPTMLILFNGKASNCIKKAMAPADQKHSRLVSLIMRLSSFLALNSLRRIRTITNNAHIIIYKQTKNRIQLNKPFRNQRGFFIHHALSTWKIINSQGGPPMP